MRGAPVAGNSTRERAALAAPLPRARSSASRSREADRASESLTPAGLTLTTTRCASSIERVPQRCIRILAVVLSFTLFTAFSLGLNVGMVVCFDDHGHIAIEAAHV